MDLEVSTIKRTRSKQSQNYQSINKHQKKENKLTTTRNRNTYGERQ